MHRKPGLLHRLGVALRPAGRGLHRAGRAIGPIVLDAAGLGLLSAAAFMVAVPFGVAVAGVSCFVLNYLVLR